MLLLSAEASSNEPSVLRRTRALADETNVVSLDFCVSHMAAEDKMGAVAQPLRAALTGTTASPGIFDVMAALGATEALARIDDVCGTAQ